MHIYFSGIGGTGIGPLALIAHEAGFEVSGSDKQDSSYIRYLKAKGISDISIGQSYDHIEKIHKDHPIDWIVYTSALPIEQPDAPELAFAQKASIRSGKRDDLINMILSEKHLDLIAIAGTHGKTTTTAMAIWLFKQLGIPVSYSVGAKISFGEMGHFDPDSKFFVYEADEYDRNFLSFNPSLSVITGIDWDHPDIYPTQDEYNEAFRTFLSQSRHSILWQSDIQQIGSKPPASTVLNDNDPKIDRLINLPGKVNRRNAWQVAQALHKIDSSWPFEKLTEYLNNFPGVSRRFEQIKPHLLYSDYAHTPPKIRGALQTAQESAGDKVVVVYEGLHNTRQHFIKDELVHLFDDVRQLYIVPSYLAREDKTLKLLSPDDLEKLLSPESQAHTQASMLDSKLKSAISNHLDDGDLVLCLSAGGGHSLDEWLRHEYSGKT